MSTYRPNAATIITDGNGLVLLCERVDQPGAVQTVQGGIDPGETPREAAMRELWEEIGLKPEQYEIIAELTEPIRYDWPPEVKAKLKKPKDRDFEGQEQYFFLARVAPDTVFDLDTHHEREFSNVQWGMPAELVSGSWAYKQAVLRAALTQFGLL